MLLLLRNLYGTNIEVSDGKLGKLIDFLFDDQKWHVTRLVLDAGTWLQRRRVSLPPDIIESKDWADHRLSIAGLTRQQVLNTPGTETHLPVSVHAALEEVSIMDWEVYWTSVLGTDHPWQITEDPHIYSTQEVAGYYIHGTDARIGHVADFVINDETWTISQLVVDTRTWWPGRHVLVPTARVEEISGPNRSVRLQLSRDAIQNSPSVKSLVVCEV